MSYTSNTPPKFLYVDSLISSPEGSMAYIKDAKGFGKIGSDSQSLAYSISGTWVKNNDEKEVIPSGQSLWNVGGIFNNWNPDTGSYNLSSIEIRDSSNNYGGTGNGVYSWLGFIDLPINGYTIKILVNYLIKDSLRGGSKVPGIIMSHGWAGSYQQSYQNYTDNNYAVMTYDWAGTYNGSRSYPTDKITIYPSELNRLNQVVNPGADDAYQSSVTNAATVKGMDMYYWTAMAKRVLSYFRTITDVNSNKIGFWGNSWGGTIAWNMCTDDRLKAIVAYYGCGWIHYWRTNNLYKYFMPPEPQVSFSEGDNRYISTLECQSYTKRAKVPILWLGGTNDYHGRLDRGLDNFDLLPSNIDASFAFEANEAHSSQVNTIQDDILWFNKYLKDQNVTWYKNVTPTCSLSSNGYPMITIAPDSPSSLSAIKIWYSLENPYDVTRTWLSAVPINNGNGTWSAVTPVENIYRYVFSYGLLTYNNTVAVCTRLGAVIPNKLGNATSIPTSYFTPASASSSTLNLWLDGNDKNTLSLNSSNKVGVWYDKSSTANHCVSVGNGPILVNDSVYGLSALNMSGGCLVSQDPSTQRPYFDLFIVTRYDDGSTWQMYPKPTPPYLFTAGTNAPTTLIYSGTTLSTNGLSNGIYGTWTVNTANSTLTYNNSGLFCDFCDYYLNGSLIANAATSTSRTVLPNINTNAGILNFRFRGTSLGIPGYTLGGLKGGAYTWNGTICEVISYNTLLSDSERQKIEGYLAYKWGLRDYLPSGHPYKSIRPT